MSSDETAAPFERIERAVLQLGWLGQRQFMQLLAEVRFGLTVPQFYTLLHLSLCQGACKMSDLARTTQQSAASLTGVIDRLIDKQLVERGRPTGDRRQVMVWVTPSGQTMLDEVRQARSQAMRSACGDMSTAEVAGLIQLLEQLCAGMNRQFAGQATAHEPQ